MFGGQCVCRGNVFVLASECESFVFLMQFARQPASGKGT